MSVVRLRKAVVFIASIAFIPIHTAVQAQSFSCSFGTSPACLEYGDKVCSSFGKCVAERAICFESYQCNFEGFTCKSNLSECAESFESLRRDYNQLLENSEDLVHDYGQLKRLLVDAEEENATLLDERNDLEATLFKATTELESLKECLMRVYDLSHIESCLR